MVDRSNLKKNCFTKTQIIGMLKEVESRVKITELCCKHAVSENTYKWCLIYSELGTVIDTVMLNVHFD